MTNRCIDRLCSLCLIIVWSSWLAIAAPAAIAGEADRTLIIDTARKYLIQGLVEHKPSLVPLAENCWREEQGINTGRSGAEIKQRLLRDEYRVITGISDERWVVEGDQAVVFYNLHVSSVKQPVLIAERFKVVHGLIEEIEALIHRPASTGD